MATESESAPADAAAAPEPPVADKKRFFIVVSSAMRMRRKMEQSEGKKKKKATTKQMAAAQAKMKTEMWRTLPDWNLHSAAHTFEQKVGEKVDEGYLPIGGSTHSCVLEPSGDYVVHYFTQAMQLRKS